MRHYSISPSFLNGSVIIPPSKSQTMRAILFAALAKGTSTIQNYLDSSDTNCMLQACKMLGANIEINNNRIEIEGINGYIPTIDDVIHAGNSGIILRFLTGIAALSSNYTVITGDRSLRSQRSMSPMIDALNQLGAFTVSSRGDSFAPVIVKGPIKGGKVEISGKDSQPISSLLIACSLAEGTTELIAHNSGEKPWVDLTLHWLEKLGGRCKNENYAKYTIFGNTRFQCFDYTVPGDWSSAAFPIAAALVTKSSLTLENVDWKDPQGDKNIVDVLIQMGAHIEIDEKTKRLYFHRTGRLKGSVIDVNPIIDAVPILAVLACFAEGETRLMNAGIARTKECDRLHCITQELQKMGADIIEQEDSLIIRGKELYGAKLNSHEDHRLAMSLAIAAMGAKGDSVLENVDCISKTFPDFAQTFLSLGAKLS